MYDFITKKGPVYTHLWSSSAKVWRSLCVVALIVFTFGTLHHQRTISVEDIVRTLEAPIFNSTLGFQKILVLNLPERTDHADWVRLAAAVTDLEIEFVDGVDGDEVLDKVLPYPPHRELGKGNIGSWRAHMNAMAHVVSKNLASALILEDDADWDIRIKRQMRDFARGTRLLTQPVLGSDHQYADPTFLNKRPRAPQRKHDLGKDDDHLDFFDSNAPITEVPSTTPYGDDWDVLWVGHCAMHFPRAQDRVPKGRFLFNDDSVIPQANMTSADPKVWPHTYPAQTRVVHHVWDPICTYAYAVSQRGARKILWELGIKRFDLAFDNMMVDFCDANICLTMQPQLFSSFAAPGPVNRDSEINGFGQDKSTGIREKGQSENIQRSVRMNMQAILDGTPLSELEDQYPHEK